MNEEEEVATPRLRELIVYYAYHGMTFEDLKPIFRTQVYISKLVLVNLVGELDFGTLSQLERERRCRTTFC
jgi:hypothetical protein